MARQFDSIPVDADTTPAAFDVVTVNKQRGSNAEIVIYVSNPTAAKEPILAGGTGRVSLVNEGETAHSALFVDPGESKGFGGYDWVKTEAPVRLLCEDGTRPCRVTVLAEGTP